MKSTRLPGGLERHDIRIARDSGRDCSHLCSRPRRNGLPVETGSPAPLDRLCRSTRMVDWQLTTAPNTTVPAEVLFAGLAPGIVGRYQIDVRIPPYNGYEFIELSDGVRPHPAKMKRRSP